MRIVTVFRSRLRPGGEAAYRDVADVMSDLARRMPGFVDHVFYTSADGERVTIVRFADRASHRAWAEHSEHLAAQRRGRDEFYSWYDISVSEETYGRVFEGPDDPARSIGAGAGPLESVSGGTDLVALIRSMRPRREPGEFVFVVAPTVPDGVDVRAFVSEAEGQTLVVPREDADRAGLRYDYVAGWITLDVHSALAAVGLTAAVSGALAGARHQLQRTGRKPP